jgi:PEP-CTERM motif
MSRHRERNRVPRSFLGAFKGVLAASIAIAFLVGAPARADLTIIPTFDSSITSLPGAAAIEGAINSAISAVESAITSPNHLTVTIDFQNMTSGLGQSNTTAYFVSYYDYYNAYKAVATSTTQLTALASLGAAPTSETSGNPVTGTDQMLITSAEGRNLGFTTPGNSGPGGTYDSVIGLNTSITSPPNTLNGNTYGLQSTATHEIDEVLGIGGPGSNLGNGSTIGDLDLYRYSSTGVRSYSTTAPSSYFSINGGNTVLSYFNQTSGADYADWLSNPIPQGYQPQVQDAFGMPGTDPTLGVNELTAFNAIGYALLPSSVPEPSTLTMMGTALLLLAGYGRSRRKQRACRSAA